MNDRHVEKIAGELGLKDWQVTATGGLLAEGGTVPFISRYRKEATGSLDEVAITAIRDRLEQLEELDKRREAILKSLDDRELLTDELKGKINAAETLAVLEDIYLPFRPKRRTRATIAREKGLEPLAEMLFAQAADVDPEAAAKEYIDQEKEVNTVEDALAGARDIIAETVNEDQQARAKMRELFATKGVMKSKVMPKKEQEGAKFRDYFDWQEVVADAPSHRVLAMRRGEKEKFLMVRIEPEEVQAHSILKQMFVKGDSLAAKQVSLAVEDCYKRLLSLSMETEIRMESKKRADEEAISVFADNLRELMLSSPLGRKRVLAIDPGFRTGCKIVCLDEQGKLLHDDLIYPTAGSASQKTAAEHTVMALCAKFDIEAIAIGNGTASRETETFVRSIGLPKEIMVVMVSENGASVYSASDVAREEFPDKDVTVRGAISIGRRLMDPLAELIKIDAKSIGVGQYQHDVDQTALKTSLDDTVASCVNSVGVELNTASKQLLTYVSGLGPQLAENIVAMRNEKGPFDSRKAVMDVPRLGAKAFEQAAGFLRVRESANPLDASAVHPESYAIVKAMAGDVGCTVNDLMRDAQLRAKIDPKKYVTEKVGLPTLNDILAELAKPGRDPREKFEAFQFAEGVEKIEDVKIGMKLPGVVTNVTKFGAFVDVGVHQDGLVHISALADHFVKDPTDEVKVQQKVMVTVLDVDLERKRIALSMKSEQQDRPAREEPKADRPKGNRQAGKQPKRVRTESSGGGWFSSMLDDAKKKS